MFQSVTSNIFDCDSASGVSEIVNSDYWVDFFDMDEDAEFHASNLRTAGLEAAFLRPDWPLQVTPYLIEWKTAQSLASAYGVLHDTITRLPDILFNGDLCAFAHAVGFWDDAHQVLLRDLVRNDGILPCRWDVCANGVRWQAMEANFGGALGGLPTDWVQKLYDRLQGDAGEIRDTWYSAGAELAQALKAQSAGRDTQRFVVVDDEAHFSQSPLTANSTARYLSSHLEQDIRAIGHTALEQFVADTPGPVTTFELFTLNDIARRTDDSYAPYLSLCKTGQVRRGVSLLCDLYMSKATLALLYKAAVEEAVSPEVQDIIRSAIPYTEIITPENHAALAGLAKDAHVLKSAIGHGGSGVFCGWEHDSSTWESLLGRAASQQDSLGLCVIQARVKGDRRLSTSLTPQGLWIESDEPQVIGINQVNGQFCGGSVRQSIEGGGVVNAARMASVGVMRVVQDIRAPQTPIPIAIGT